MILEAKHRVWYWPYSEAYYGEFSEGEYYVIFIFIEHCGLDKERKVKKKKRKEKQHERAENSTADISFIEKEVVTLKKKTSLSGNHSWENYE